MDIPRPQASSTLGPDLLARVAAGDRDAFEQLYEQSISLLFPLAQRILGNEGDAADLLQEVYLEAWRKASNYEAARGTPMAWLTTMARSRAIDRVRTLNARGRGMTGSLDDAPASDLIASNTDALEMRAGGERRALLSAALKSLTVVQRQAIELAYFEGLTHMEIADRLKVPLGTIKTRIRLGMEKLRDDLRSVWEEDLGISK
jgi:RNA polymerase sigma-70 factor (ECF subfamily)